MPQLVVITTQSHQIAWLIRAASRNFHEVVEVHEPLFSTNLVFAHSLLTLASVAEIHLVASGGEVATAVRFGLRPTGVRVRGLREICVRGIAD